MSLAAAAIALLVTLGDIPLTPSTNPVSFPYDDGSWKKPLDQKAMELEQVVLERHSIDGLYPSQLTLIDGKANLTTTGHADVSHAINWTTSLYAGVVYRWKLTQSPEDWARVKEVFGAIKRCHDVNGVEGLISRGYVKGHGPSYEERRGHGGSQNNWNQGKGEFSEYRWRGSPSHHNHSGFFRAMGLTWATIDDPEIRAEVKRLTAAVGQRVFIDNDFTIRDWNGESTFALKGFFPMDKPTMPGFYLTTELKVLAEVTGEPRYQRMYEQMCRQMGYYDYADKPVEDLIAVAHVDDWDDTDHTFQHLDTLRYFDDDPVLKRFYLKWAQTVWETHKDERQGLYNLYYHAATGEPGRPEDVVWWLKHYPTNKVFQPRVNSIRHDIDFDNRTVPLPLSERPFDNEYDYKANPWKLDGWMARIVTEVEASPIDPMVVYASDAGGYVYRSNDGGESWLDTFRGLGGAHVNAVLPSSEEIEIVIAATNRGVQFSRDAGYSWEVVHPGDALDLVRDSDNPLVVYAAMRDGIAVCAPHPTRNWGRAWRPLGLTAPSAPMRRYFIVKPAGKVVFFAQDMEGTIWRAAPGDSDWTSLLRPLGRKIGIVDVCGSPDGKVMMRTDRRGALIATPDLGLTWEPVSRAIDWYDTSDYPLDDVEILDATYHPTKADFLTVGAHENLWVSQDGGKSWETSTEGLDIPHAHALMTCEVTGALYAGTQSGLYRSDDDGASWQRCYLVPMYEGLNLWETGPADYLTTYWVARYLGVVTEEMAQAPWTE